jgi:hypothetical protein
MSNVFSTGATDAFNSLAADSSWRALLAENLLWASSEGFLQASLLGALNVRGGDHVFDRECVLDRLPSKFQPDFLAIRRTDYVPWWRAKSSRDPAAMRGLCVGVGELKLAWTAGNATASANVTNMADSVAAQARRLAEHCAAHGHCLPWTMVLVSGFHPASVGRPALDACLSTILDRVSRAGLGWAVRSVDVFDGLELPHWSTLGRRPDRALHARLLVLAPAEEGGIA